MLSPGQWHELVPKDPLENIAFRLDLLQAAERDPLIQRGLIEICRQDICFYVNAFVWQYNPDNIDCEVEPFILYDFQEAAIREVLDRLFVQRKPMVEEKSRKLGATWKALIVFDWMSLFHERKKFLAISHSEKAVDEPDDSDSLFWKVEFMHDHLPDWLRRGAKKRKLGFTYPATKSSFTGSATTERSGVGGRATALLADEFSRHPKSWKILEQTRDTGPCLFISTHNDLAGAFFHLTTRKDLSKVVMHWTQHPERKKGLYRSGTKGGFEVLDTQYDYSAICGHYIPKTMECKACVEHGAKEFKFNTSGKPTGGPFPGLRSPWYDSECEGRTDRGIAIDLDINPTGSMSQSFNQLLIRDLILAHACDPLWEGDVLYDPETGVPTGLSKRPGGDLRLWVRPDNHDRIPPAPYGVSNDLSQGTGSTPSCLSIGNLATGHKVGELVTARMDPKEFAVLAVAICQLFADEDGQGATLVWEVPGPGLSFGPKVRDLGYPNRWKRYREDLLTGQKTESEGWVNNSKNANKLLLEYRIALEKRQFLNYSERALKQTGAFKFDANGNETSAESVSVNDPSGAKINHGDIVIADAMLWMLMKGKGPQGRRLIEEPPPKNSLAGRRQLRHDRERQNDGWTQGGRACSLQLR